MSGARVLVTGGRTYADREFVFATLDRLHAEQSIELVIHGAARGADELARQWAISRSVEHDPNPAQWNRIEGVTMDMLRRSSNGKLYDVGAGFKRNQAMLAKQPTHAVAFPGGRGTGDMCHRIQVAIHRGQAIRFIDLRKPA